MAFGKRLSSQGLLPEAVRGRRPSLTVRLTARGKSVDGMLSKSGINHTFQLTGGGTSGSYWRHHLREVSPFLFHSPDPPNNEEDCHEDSIGAYMSRGRACLPGRPLASSVCKRRSRRHSRTARRRRRRRGALRRTQRAAAGAGAGDVARMMNCCRQSTGDAERARQVLVYDARPGIKDSSIPLAAKMIDERKKTGAWSTNVSYDPAAMSADSLKQYDACFCRARLHVPRRSQQSRPHRGAAKALARLRAKWKGWRAFTRRPTPTTRGRRRGGPPAAEAPPGARQSRRAARGSEMRRSPLWPEFNRTIGATSSSTGLPTPITSESTTRRADQSRVQGPSRSTPSTRYITFNQDSWSRETSTCSRASTIR